MLRSFYIRNFNLIGQVVTTVHITYSRSSDRTFTFHEGEGVKKKKNYTK